MIENILILDTETTGLDPNRGALIIEIAVILFNVKYKTILQQFSSLLPCEINPVEHINQIKAEATQTKYPFINKITKEDMEAIWRNPEAAHSIVVDDRIMLYRILKEMSDASDAVVAHHAEFDKKFVMLIPGADVLLDKRWICTKRNFSWPAPLPRFRLEDICNAMKVPYINAHRALADCNLLAQCFEKVEDLEERINRC